jgi:hypothetical protein
MMRNARQQTEREIDRKIGNPAERDALKAAARDAFDAIEATIKEGQIDGAASVNISADSLTLVAGGHIKEPSKIEDAVHKLEDAMKAAPDFPGIKWNAANHAGVKFHTLAVPIPEKEEAGRKLFGAEMNVAIGIGPDAVYVAIGKDNSEAVNKAIDASVADKSKTVPPFAISLSLGPIMELAASTDKGKDKAGLQAMADSLKQAKGRDHVRAHGSVLPNGIRYRLEAEEGVLQAIGAAAKMKQQQRAAAAN